VTRVPLAVAARVWFSISLRTFGGPAGQIAVMHRELVEERRWIGNARFLHALSFCTLLPGPEAQQLAIYLGWLLNGTRGGLIAGTLFVLPGYASLMVLSWVYVAWGATPLVAGVLAGLAPAVLAVVVQAVFRIGKRTLLRPVHWTIALSAFALLTFTVLPFPVLVFGAACMGYVSYWVWPLSHGNGVAAEDVDVEDDALHCEAPSLRRAITILAVGLPLWLLPTGVLAISLGSRSVLVTQGVFFSGTALATFGGAYAVLAFVAQRAVSQYHWLQPGEMVHGLALAETTPGPLIMVLEFVGFLGAFRNPGTMNPWLCAVLGASLVVWVTFVPCFLLVFLGAPHVEALRHNRTVSAALSAVSAAVVGVIANLSVYFALHTLFARTRTVATNGFFRVEIPEWAGAQRQAVVLTMIALLLIFAFKQGVLRVFGICGAVGALSHFCQRVV
jgi:chromate transporter